jgi:nitroreductase
MDFFDVVATQRAIRRFLPDPVPDDLLARVLDAATRAPSARGAEPWAFVVVRDAALRAEIGRLYLAAWEMAEQFTEAADADRDVKASPHYARMMRGADALARALGAVPVHVVCGLDHARLGPIADGAGGLRSPGAAYASILPAVQNLLLAARAVGLGTTLTTLHRAFEPALRELLRLPDSIEPVVLVPLGFPRDRFGATRRRPLCDVVHLDRWGTPYARLDAPAGDS